MSITDPTFLLPILGVVVFGFGIVLNGGAARFRAGNPTRAQIICGIGVGLSAGAFGLTLMSRGPAFPAVLVLLLGLLMTGGSLFWWVKTNPK